ncbi:hypothetical protein [Piscinibacter sp. HJYY11]|uniref:hypothetical protein n=1 Tax=Piscinibacter sp. HJYY11 TaxID=2801333 RepID=UPI00191F24BE|nr:hypothetical protein [Piscinibacter sp. HJYY11]MBL0731122.1 hypothetical protein [Piscinibacter sp. HJYY11]
MTPQKNTSHDLTARYLVLLDQEDVTRALLFAQDHRYLAEVIDDDTGLLVDNLMKAGTRCVPPREVAEQARTEEPAKLLCFALEWE